MNFLKVALPYVISGVSVGGQYALIAIGYTMVYGILRLINFAHGDVFMVAGLLMVYIAASFPLYVAIPAVIILTVLLGFTIERVAYRPLRSAPRMSVMISAIGVSYLLQNLALYITGGLNKNYPPIPWISDRISVFGLENHPRHGHYAVSHHHSGVCPCNAYQPYQAWYGDACCLQGF